jgi:hypothetical protein
MHDWGIERIEADALIREFGGAVTIRRASQSGPAWDPVVTTADTAAVAVLMEFEKDATHFDGQPIEAGDKRALITAEGLAIAPDPTTDSFIGPDARTYRIVRVKPLQPAGTVLFYDTHLRG